MRAVGAHADFFQRIVHALSDFFCGYTQVLRTKGDVFFDDGRDQLVIRILKDHADLLPDVPDMLHVAGFHAFYDDLARRRKIQSIEMPGECRLAAPICANDGGEGSPRDRAGHIRQRVESLPVLRLEGMCQMTDGEEDLFPILCHIFFHMSSFLRVKQEADRDPPRHLLLTWITMILNNNKYCAS